MGDWSNIITAGVGPVIVISACGLLCLAFYNRLAAVVTRLRGFHRERLHEHEAMARESDEAAIRHRRELLAMLEEQTRRVTRRARLIRAALMCLLVTIACLAVCSLALGLSSVWPALTRAAAALFLAGLALLVAGVGFALVEIANALDPIELESRFVTEAIRRIGGDE